MFNINPYSRAIRKYIYDMIPEYYTPEIDEVSERVAASITTEPDVQRFARLMGAIYSAGYTKAMKDTHQKLEEHGIKLKIVKPQ